MLNFFYRFYKTVILFEFLDRFQISPDFMKLPNVSKVEISFFFSDLDDLEDIRLLNFLQFFEEYFETTKFPFLKKIFFNRKNNCKICVIYTFRKNDAFDFLEFFFSRYTNFPAFAQSSFFKFFFFQKNTNLLINIKNLSFFDDRLLLVYEFSKITGNVNIFFEGIEDQTKLEKDSLKDVKNFLEFLGLNEDNGKIEIKNVR